MRRRTATIALRAAVRAGTATVALAVCASLAAGAAGAKPYGRGEDLLLRFDPRFEDPLWPVTWMFYVLAAITGGWAMLRFKMHFDAPKPGGPIAPAVGIGFAVALATVPALIDALTEGLPPGYRPPVWRAE